MSGTANATQATPPPVIPPAIKTYVDVEIAKGVEAALASRAQAQAAAQPAPITGKDLQLDLSENTRQKRLYASLGLRLKAAYLDRANHFGLGKEEKYKALGAFLDRTKAAGQFISIFEQGGVFARETVSSDLVELTRPNSILLAAGIRTVSGYGAQLTMGTIDEGVTVYWVAEGEPPAVSQVKTGRLVLQAHKVMALGRLANDLLQLASVDAAAILGQDMAAAIALELDTVGLKGVGAKKPNGLRTQMAAAQRTASAGTSTANKISDVDGLMAAVHKANIPGGLKANNAFYYMDVDTFISLRQTRDNSGWVFPELREDPPTLNGFPVFITETLMADDVMGFGLAQQYIMGEARPLEVSMGETGNDFSSDMVTMRGITSVDFVLRYSKAFAEKTGLGY